jgi:hypothetical protein
MTRLLLLPFTLMVGLVVTPALAHPSEFHTQAQTRPGLSNAEQTRMEEIRQKVEEARAAAQERRLTVFRDLCDRMADHRVKTLEALRTRVANADLTDAEKQELYAVIEEKVAAINAIRTECTSQTTAEGARTQIQNMQRGHHVFAAIMPRLHAMRATFKAKSFIGRLENHVATMQKLIDKAKDRGCDTTAAEAALAAYQEAVRDAKEHHNNAVGIATTFTNDADPGAKRDEVKTEMQAMVASLREAHNAHKTLIAELRTCFSSTSENGEDEESSEGETAPAE